MHVARAALLALALPAAAHAGIPTEEPMTCPIGGEEFTVTGTMSCTTFSPHLLSLAPQTSCDFVTQLPQCPGNGLPVYKAFSADETRLLEGLVGTAGYENIRENHSRFYLAWWLAAQLGEQSRQGRFFLLLRGLWWDTGRVLEDRDHLGAARDELTALMPEVIEEEKAIYLGIGAYLSVLLDDFEAAGTWLAEAETAHGELKNDLAESYIAALRACIATGDKSSELCAPRLGY